ncbi:MAG: iron-containing alcohol dehydrogenase [Lentisphaeria bacterium]|nr:iron-containing alcohol dehydrogenase [Lentisphaeria bacterium]
MKLHDIRRTFAENTESAITFGPHAAHAFAARLKQRACRKLAVFTGSRSAAASGALTAIQTAAADAGAAVSLFPGIPAEPDILCVRQMAAFLQTAGPDTVAALGGGSVMDAAKAAWIMHQSSRDAADFFGSNRSSEFFPGRHFDRILAIPTTSGTGSETTCYSNIVEPSAGVKKLISDPQIIPEAAFVDPAWSTTMPESVTRATGCDALAHLLEGFLNTGQDDRHPAANRWALTGIRLLTDWLPRAIATPTPEAREAVSAAAVLGGMVIRWKSTGLPHLCSFSWFGRIEHGIAAILLLPAAWRYYLGNPAVAARTMELSGIFPGRTPEEVIVSFRKFLDTCGVAADLSAYPAVTPELLECTAASAAENPMKLALAPRPVPLDEAAGVIRKILQNR